MLEQKMNKSALVSRRSFSCMCWGIMSGTVLMILSVWPGIFVCPLQAQSVEANPVLGATYSCSPANIGIFDNRIHVRCSASTSGIWYFAVSTKDSSRAARYLSILTTAKITGKNITVYYDPNDTSGAAWGCGANDCRNISGAEVW